MSIIIDGKEYYGIIYKIENTVAYKIYIGQTSSPRGFNGRYLYQGTGIERVYNCLKSKKEHDAYYNPYLLRSIEKYGFEAFTVDEIYDTAMTHEELNEKEQYYIAKFDSFKNGYNLTCGGDGITGCKSGDCKNSKRICQLSLDGKLIKIWECATDASKALNIPVSGISNVCRKIRRRKGGGISKTSGGYVWVFESEYNVSKDYSVKRPKQNMRHGSKAILLLSKDGRIIQEFYSLNEASRQLKDVSVEGIRKICQHKFENPRYNLIYKSEYLEEQRLNVEESYENAA